MWNHTFVYDDVTLQELAERALELTVWDHDRLASNEFLGGVRFSLGTSRYLDLQSSTAEILIEVFMSTCDRLNTRQLKTF